MCEREIYACAMNGYVMNEYVMNEYLIRILCKKNYEYVMQGHSLLCKNFCWILKQSWKHSMMYMLIFHVSANFLSTKYNDIYCTFPFNYDNSTETATFDSTIAHISPISILVWTLSAGNESTLNLFSNSIQRDSGLSKIAQNFMCRFAYI